MKKVKLTLSYDGTRYGGWQRQKDGKPTVQGEIEKALQKILSNSKIRICGSGRTDSGVHAYAQVAHCWVPDSVDSVPLVRGLNGLMPKDISVKSAYIVNDEFHAIASSEKKTYQYKIYNSPTPFALSTKYKLWVRKPLDIDKLNEMSKVFVGTHDFKSFMTSGSPVPSTTRTVYKAQWVKSEADSGDLSFFVAGNGFLKQMVRNLVGTLLHLHNKGLGKTELLDILAAKDRRKAHVSAPAHGLYLMEVQYPKEISKPLKILN